MEKRKASQDAEVAAKTITQRASSSSIPARQGEIDGGFRAFVACARAWLACGVVQFIKGAWDTGERQALARFPDQLAWHTMGEGFTWETQDRAGTWQRRRPLGPKPRS